MTVAAPFSAPTARDQVRADRHTWWVWMGLCGIFTALFALLAVNSDPPALALALALFLAGIVGSLVQPRISLLAVVFFTLVGDPVVVPWYPFYKNFSSHESLMFVSDSLKASPLELLLVGLLFGWMARMAAQRNWHVTKGRLWYPILAFAFFAAVGMAWGQAKGGDLTIALWESRTIFAIPITYLLALNLLKTPKHFEAMWWCVMVAVFINGINTSMRLRSLTEADKKLIENFVSHGATLPMNALFILLIASFLFKPSSAAMRWALPFMSLPVLYAYIGSQRRAAFVSLAGALVVVGVALFWNRRRAFKVVAPIAIVIGVMYTGAFWNSTGSLGIGAQAIKSVISPNSVSERDAASNNYRKIEGFDILATIRSNRLLGVGFGRPFQRPIPLPAISNFLLKDYITHNSMLWIWMKMGVGGFVAMLFLFAMGLRTGGRAVVATAYQREGPLVIAAACFIVMYAIFTYVDISWDPQNVFLLAACFAAVDSALLRAAAGAPVEAAPAGDEVGPAPRQLAATR